MKKQLIDFFITTFLSFRIFLYQTLHKDDSQLCYERYNRMIEYTIYLYAVRV